MLTSPEALLDEAIGIATRIAANPGPQVGWTKQLFAANSLEQDLGRVQERESELLRRCWTSAEHAEAVSAFLEKRPAVFPPRSRGE